MQKNWPTTKRTECRGARRGERTHYNRGWGQPPLQLWIYMVRDSERSSCVTQVKSESRFCENFIARFVRYDVRVGFCVWNVPETWSASA
jgi:hypothetical protein